MSSNLKIEDFFDLKHKERIPLLIEAIFESHKYHFNNNFAYRKTVSARGINDKIDIMSLERLLRPAALTFKSYIERTGPFPQDHPLLFIKWLNEQLSVPLPSDRFSYLRKKYWTFESLLEHIEKIYADMGIEMVTSSGTSGKASVVLRDKETIEMAIDAFFTGIYKAWGISRGTSLVFVMPEKTRVTMARTASLGTKYLRWTDDAAVYFTMPFKANTDIIRIRSGRVYRNGLMGQIEKRIINPWIAWAYKNLAEPKFMKTTLKALDECIKLGKPLMLLGAATQLHLFAQKYKMTFPEGSRIATGGGMKEMYPFTFDQIRQDLKTAFGNIPVSDVYGMSEANWAAFECPEGNYHIPPWIYAVVTDNSDKIINSCEATGLLAFFDPVGGGNLLPPFFQTADRVCLVNGGSEYSSDLICPCGQDTAYIRGSIMRVDLIGEAGCAAQV